MKTALQPIEHLGKFERVRIASALWSSVADQPHALVLKTEQSQELDARHADYLAHPNEGMSWADALVLIRQPR